MSACGHSEACLSPGLGRTCLCVRLLLSLRPEEEQERDGRQHELKALLAEPKPIAHVVLARALHLSCCARPSAFSPYAAAAVADAAHSEVMEQRPARRALHTLRWTVLRIQRWWRKQRLALHAWLRTALLLWGSFERASALEHVPSETKAYLLLEDRRQRRAAFTHELAKFRRAVRLQEHARGTAIFYARRRRALARALGGASIMASAKGMPAGAGWVARARQYDENFPCSVNAAGPPQPQKAARAASRVWHASAYLGAPSLPGTETEARPLARLHGTADVRPALARRSASMPFRTSVKRRNSSALLPREHAGAAAAPPVLDERTANAHATAVQRVVRGHQLRTLLRLAPPPNLAPLPRQPRWRALPTLDQLTRLHGRARARARAFGQIEVRAPVEQGDEHELRQTEDEAEHMASIAARLRAVDESAKPGRRKKSQRIVRRG